MKTIPPSTNTPLGDENDDDYKQRSRTPPSETFSHEEERHQRRRIEGATLPRRFQQPTFTIYNGNTDPVEHVSQFNQRMAVHSKNEALMRKVFPQLGTSGDKVVQQSESELRRFI